MSTSSCTCGHNLSGGKLDEAPCDYCKTADIALVGEAYGAEEERKGLPFQGSAGRELRDQLHSVGIKNAYLTNVLNLRPINNDLSTVLVKKDWEGKVEPALAPGKYFPKDVIEPQLLRLKRELEAVNPKVVIALGNTALWALSGQSPKIGKERGTVSLAHLVSCLLVPTYHPAAVLRQYKWRSIAQADLIKAKAVSKKGFKAKKRTFLINPTKEEIHNYIETQIKGASLLSFDIETKGRFITCVGFAPSGESAMVVPFVVNGKSYWENFEDEVWAWTKVKEVLALPIPKLAQNGLFDIQYLYSMKIPVMNYAHDTMILHHALQPEMEKSLGFLASVYLNEPSWKDMRSTDKTGK